MTIGQADLDDIDAAIMAALEQGSVANGGPFRTIGRWAGAPVGPLSAEAVSLELFGNTPSAMLAFVAEMPQKGIGTLAGGGQIEGKSLWNVLVAVSDPRSTGKAVKGSTGLSGAYALASAVIGALNFLIVPAPAATLRFAVTGTPSATVPLGTSVLRISGVSFQPTAASVTLDGSGNGTVDATCITPGALGNYAPRQPAAWSTTPAGLSGFAVVSASVTAGVEGLLRNTRVEYAGTRVVAMIPGRIVVLGAQFHAVRRIPEADFTDEGQPFARFTGSLHNAEPPTEPQLVQLVPTGFPAFGSGITIDGQSVMSATGADLAEACSLLANAINTLGLVTATASATNVLCVSPLSVTRVYSNPTQVTVTPLTSTDVDPLDTPVVNF